jgi:cytochrome c5
MTEHPLDGVRSKIERAWAHRKQLRAEIKAFEDTKPYTIIARPGDTPGEYLACLRAAAEPPIGLSVLAGEMAYEYISALNHVAWVLAARKLGKKRAWNERMSIQFPIGLDPAQFRKQAIVKKHLVSQQAVRIMGQVQPYTGRDGEEGARKHSLWLIKELADSDKHRVLAPRVSSLLLREWEYGWDHLRRGEKFTITKVLKPGQRLKDGMVLGRLEFPDGKDRENVEVQHADIPTDVYFETEEYMLNLKDFGNVHAFMHRALDQLAPLFPSRP